MFRKLFLVILFFLLKLPSIFSQYFVSTYSGNTTGGFDNGTIENATFNSPFGMCIDKNNNIYIADAGNNCIRKINTVNGTVTTLAGTVIAGWKDGAAAQAKFSSPADVCVDDSGNVFVSDFLNHRIRKISASGIVSTVAGTGTAGFANGNYLNARFSYPRGICLDAVGNLYIGDSWNHRIRKIDTARVVSTYAGGGTAGGVGSIGSLVDASDTSARFYTPSGLAIDNHGNIYVADAYNHRIRKIDTSRTVSTFVGNGPTGNGNGGFMNGGQTEAILNTPTEIFVDTNSNELYISDTFNNRIRKTEMISGMVSTFAGNGLADYIDSLDALSSFNYPRGLVLSVGATKKVYVNDYSNNIIRLIEYKSGVGVTENLMEDNIIVFPNPSNGIFTIKLLNTFVKELSIFDILGKAIKKLTPGSQTSISIDLGNTASGIYYLKIRKISGETIVKKIYVE